VCLVVHRTGSKYPLVLEAPAIHPVDLFRIERDRAEPLEAFDVTRVSLATATKEGRPSVRYVLLKHIDRERGLSFFTHYDGRKGRELEENPYAALAVHYGSTGIQLRAEGTVTRMSESESDAYFASRPRESQLGAWASPQSRAIADRDELIARVSEAEARFPSLVPRPPSWGGYWLCPDRIEIWANGDARLHDRFCYTRTPDGAFEVVRLAP
jgi:pyridoxamine 5'-phosphate oxidase